MTTPRIARRLGVVLATALTCLGLAACVTTGAPGYGTTSGSGGNAQSLTDMVDSGLTIQAERGSASPSRPVAPIADSDH